MISPVFFLCLRVQVDEEEEVKKKRGNADQYVSDWRPLENYFESDTEKCKKRFFLVFLKLLEILI